MQNFDFKGFDFKQIKTILNEDSPKALALNALLMLTVVLFLVICFFSMYLPVTTNHGETITVPNLEGMHIDKVKEFLEERDFRFVVSDSAYDDKVAALTVIKQDPKEGERVKINRRIHLTIKALNAPLENLPNILDNPVRQADQLLDSHGFKKGKITYIPHIGKNAVLRISYKGRNISKEDLEKGFPLAKGSAIDMEVGDGLGNSEFDLPDLTGRPLVEVEVLLRGLGLNMGSIIYEKASGTDMGTVLKQSPAFSQGRKIRVGAVIDLWVAEHQVKE